MLRRPNVDFASLLCKAALGEPSPPMTKRGDGCGLCSSPERECTLRPAALLPQAATHGSLYSPAAVAGSSAMWSKFTF